MAKVESVNPPEGEKIYAVTVPLRGHITYYVTAKNKSSAKAKAKSKSSPYDNAGLHEIIDHKWSQTIVEEA